MNVLIPALAAIVLAGGTYDMVPRSPGVACAPGYTDAGPEFCRKMSSSTPDAISCSVAPPGYYRIGASCRPVSGPRI